MREFDELGLKLAKAQSLYFEESLEKYKGSSNVFIKNFMFSKEVNNVDYFLEFDSTKIDLELKKRNLSIGKKKFNPNAMIWIGYIYRYWSYIYNMDSKMIYKIANADEMLDLFYAYHTMDPKFAIDRILEEKKINCNNTFDRQYYLYKKQFNL